jgi:hypothetical protein
MMIKAGLLAACLGALLLALSTHLGGVTGFVGTAVWATPGWRLANGAGWLLLIGGFFVQNLHVRRTPGSMCSEGGELTGTSWKAKA